MHLTLSRVAVQEPCRCGSDWRTSGSIQRMEQTVTFLGGLTLKARVSSLDPVVNVQLTDGSAQPSTGPITKQPFAGTTVLSRSNDRAVHSFWAAINTCPR